jgi:acid phosphatase family membrane protein YuiD
MPEVSAYFIAAGIAWLIAQGLKYLLNSSSVGTRRVRLLYQSGNMPSAHTATMTALTTLIGIYEGLGSSIFALAAVLTMITAYDAMMARRSAGEQGLALRKLLAKSPFAKDPLPYQALGHKPLEVAAGGLLGVLIGATVAFLITK